MARGHVGWPKARFAPHGSGAVVRDALPYVSVAALLTPLYLRTLLPSVGFHMDTAKFGYLGAVLGTGHAPGEPLYLMLNAAWVQLLPIGEPAWRANLLSAVVAVLVGLVLVRVLRELAVGRWMAAVGACMIGVSRLFWQQSIVAEVYSLNTLFVAVELGLLLAWLRTRRDATLVAALGVFVVSFSNHPTGLLLLPGLAAFLIQSGGYRVVLQPRSVLVIAGFAAVALSTYAYIVWRSLDPSTAYVELDIHDWSSFWAGVTGQQYHNDMPIRDLTAFLFRRVRLGLRLLWVQYFLLTAVSIYAVTQMTHRRAAAATLTLSWALAVALFATFYPVSDFVVFYSVAWIMVGLWITVGMSRLIEHAARALASRPRMRWMSRLPLAAAALAPLTLAAINYPQVDLSDNHARARFAATVRALPANSVVFTSSYLSYHGLNYFLLPDGQGKRQHQYVTLGSGRTDRSGRALGIDRIANYCAGNDSMRLPRIRTTVPPDLHAFVFPRDYARKVAAHGYPIRHAAGELYRVSCGQHATARSTAGQVDQPVP